MNKMPKLFALTVVLSALIGVELRAQSAPSVFGPDANGPVRVVVVQPDGKILIGGDFTTLSLNGGASVTRNRMARLNPDGTLDTAFDPKANGAVESIAVQADGSILAGGQFTSIGGQKRNRVARLDGITGAADSFDPNANERVYSVVVQADGKILVGGIFDRIGGQARRHIARLDAKTGLADSFDPSPDAFGVYAIALQTDGKILAGGSFANIGGEDRNSIARLDPATGLADSFDPQPIGKGQPFAVFYAITVQSDGKILVGGDFRSIGGQPRNRIARLEATSGLADSFDPNASGGNSHPDVSAIAVQTDGRILAGGAFTSIGGQKRNHIAMLDATTGAADSFDPGANGDVTSIAVQGDGRILAGGQFFGANSIGGQPRHYFARIDATAAAAGSLDPNRESSANSSAVQENVAAVAPAEPHRRWICYGLHRPGDHDDHRCKG